MCLDIPKTSPTNTWGKSVASTFVIGFESGKGLSLVNLLRVFCKTMSLDKSMCRCFYLKSQRQRTAVAGQQEACQQEAVVCITNCQQNR